MMCYLVNNLSIQLEMTNKGNIKNLSTELTINMEKTNRKFHKTAMDMKTDGW